MTAGDARFVAAAAQPGRLPAPSLPEVAIAGRSNVGKSSLLNRLVGRRALARVSKTPGRTQQINFFQVNGRLLLVDLPGYGFAKVPPGVQQSWRRLVDAYLTADRPLRAVVVLVDVRRGMQADDVMLLDFLAHHDIPAVLAVTKIDKLKRGQRTQALRALRTAWPGLAVYPCSAATGEGCEVLWHALHALATAA